MISTHPLSPKTEPARFSRGALDAIYHRRAIRDYTCADVPASVIETLLDAAVRAPSSLNQQPWCFAVIQGRERLRGYSIRAKLHYLACELPPLGFHTRGNTLTDEDYNIFYNAGTVLVVCAKEGTFHGPEDCCLAAQNLMLAADSLGLGTCPIGIARPWLNLPEIKDELGIPTHHSAAFVMTLGYPATIPPPTPRLPAEIVAWLGP